MPERRELPAPPAAYHGPVHSCAPRPRSHGSRSSDPTKFKLYIYTGCLVLIMQNTMVVGGGDRCWGKNLHVEENIHMGARENEKHA